MCPKANVRSLMRTSAEPLVFLRVFIDPASNYQIRHTTKRALRDESRDNIMIDVFENSNFPQHRTNVESFCRCEVYMTNYRFL